MDWYYNKFLTRAYIGGLLNRLFFNIFSFFIQLVVFGSLFGLAFLSGRVLLFFCGICIWLYVLFVVKQFINLKLKDDDQPCIFRANLADEFSYEIGTNLAKSWQLSIPPLFASTLSTKTGNQIIKRLGANTEELAQVVTNYYSRNSINNAEINIHLANLHSKIKSPKIDAELILFYLFNRGEIFTQILNKLDISLEEFGSLLQWSKNEEMESRQLSKPKQITNFWGSFGRNWALGYTVDLDLITKDISETILQKRANEYIAHRDILSNILQTLNNSRQKNILILGKNGVGKTSLVYNLAYILRRYETDHNLNYSRVLMLKTTDLLYSSKDAERYLLKALSAAERSGDIILFIEDISTLLNSSISNILSRFLSSPYINIIGVESNENYHNLIKNNSAIESFFTKFILEDSAKEETLAILFKESTKLEAQKITPTYKALQSIYELCERYIGNSGFPGKGVDILQESAVEARMAKSKFLLENHVRAAITKKTRINVNEVQGSEKQKLLNLMNYLKQDVIGQDHALEALVNSLKRARLDLGQGHGPLGTFLFLGTTGVGKTETAKSLAKNYFGGSDKMIRLDMNEYSSPDSIYSIVGSPNGEEGFLVKKVQDNPFSLILLDEIEKANKVVLNTFLQILDEGMLTDNQGIKTDFRNTIIIATSNAGATYLGNRIIKGGVTDKNVLKKELLDQLVQTGLYSPEFLNRFNDILVFYPLDSRSADQVASKIIMGLVKEFSEQRGIQLRIDSQVIVYLSKAGYSPEYGAREMKRTIKDKLENYLADYMLTHEVSRGQVIPITMQQITGNQRSQVLEQRYY